MKIVALSDQHGYLPEIPPCDLLLVAGDVCPDRIGNVLASDHPERQKAWFDEYARPWLDNAPAAHKILTWGNHDWCGAACRFEAAPAAPTDVRILVDAGTSVPLQRSDGRSISVWASPWTREFGRWAFMKTEDELAEVYAAIPAGIDVLVTHQPPYRHGDRYEHPATAGTEHLGSTQLLAAIQRIKPRLVVCGHLHAGYGRFEYEGTSIFNVAVVNDDYRLVRQPTVIDIGEW